MNSSAAFDCLAIGLKLQALLENFSQSEVNLFSYLACLLSVYKKNPASEWDYKFACTKNGAPFSAEISNVLASMQQVGLVNEEKGYFRVTEDGEQAYFELRELTQNNFRVYFIEGACSCLLALPLGSIKSALQREPELSYSITVRNTRFLLEDGPGMDLIYKDFSTLSEAIGVKAEDLMVPAVIWLNYLSIVAVATA